MSATCAPARPAPAGGWLEVPACPVCAGGKRTLCFREGAVSLWSCAGCSARYVSPRMDDARLLAEVYDASYWRSPAPRERGYADYAGSTPLLRRTFERRLRALQALLPRRARVLDVGCAAGVFLELMRARGWSVHGLEPSPSMACEARRRLGRHAVTPGTLADLRHGAARFELITFWDVLEHLGDPVGALQAAAALLTPGGRVLVETQDPRSLWARLLGRRWQHYKHAEHLVHFSPRALDAALERAGLRRAAATRRGAGKYVDMGFVAERSGRLHPSLPGWLAALRGLAPGSFYVNLLDERIVLAALLPASSSREQRVAAPAHATAVSSGP